MTHNQYDLVLLTATYIRKNPSSPNAKCLKECKTQEALDERFTRLTQIEPIHTAQTSTIS